MTQPVFDFTVSLPINGRRPRQRHSSHSGAVKAGRDRCQLSVLYVELLRRKGPMTDHDAAKELKRETGSICSTRNGLGDLVIDSGEYQDTEFGTKRTLWGVR